MTGLYGSIYHPYNVVLPCPQTSVLSPIQLNNQTLVHLLLAASQRPTGLCGGLRWLSIYIILGGVPVILVTTGNCSSHQNISYNSGQKLQRVNSYLLVEVLHGPFSGGGESAVQQPSIQLELFGIFSSAQSIIQK